MKLTTNKPYITAMLKLTLAFVIGGILFACSEDAEKEQLVTGIDYEKDAANLRTLVFDNTRGARFCELFFIKLKGDLKDLHVYNPTGLNNMAKTGDSCPDSLINKVDLKGLKEHYKLDGIYFNKPRHWICDKITIPVGAKRKLGEMEWYWMASSHMPAKTEMKPGFLTYKHAPWNVNRKLFSARASRSSCWMTPTARYG